MGCFAMKLIAMLSSVANLVTVGTLRTLAPMTRITSTAAGMAVSGQNEGLGWIRVNNSRRIDKEKAREDILQRENCSTSKYLVADWLKFGPYPKKS